MENLKIIDQRKLFDKDFKIYGDFNNPLFLANDVANWINHSNVSIMLNKIDDEEKIKVEMPTLNNTYSRKNNLISEKWFLTEDGLYEVLMQSRKPIAKQFKKEVKKILKQIRQTGGYIPTSSSDSEKDILAKAVLIANSTIEQKDKLINQMKPKVEKYDTFLSAEGCLSMNKTAKSLHKGRNKMMDFLRQQGILFKEGNDNIAYQSYINNGYFRITHFTARDGIVHTTTKVTPKGVSYIHNLYQNKVGTSYEC